MFLSILVVFYLGLSSFSSAWEVSEWESLISQPEVSLGVGVMPLFQTWDSFTGTEKSIPSPHPRCHALDQASLLFHLDSLDCIRYLHYILLVTAVGIL